MMGIIFKGKFKGLQKLGEEGGPKLFCAIMYV